MTPGTPGPEFPPGPYSPYHRYKEKSAGAKALASGIAEENAFAVL
jgi:hypothetical protein